jgi:hypothetical protein
MSEYGLVMRLLTPEFLCKSRGQYQFELVVCDRPHGPPERAFVSLPVCAPERGLEVVFARSKWHRSVKLEVVGHLCVEMIGQLWIWLDTRHLSDGEIGLPHPDWMCRQWTDAAHSK